MLKFTDQSYEFKEARPNRWVYRLAVWVNRMIDLPGKRHRVKSIELSGDERLKKLQLDCGVRLVFVANHSTHSDVEVLTEGLRRCRVWGAFMAAHEVFVRSRLQSWVMQKVGAFSVNRESLDRKSIKEGVKIIKDKRYGLCLFPEGNVAFTNERVNRFLDGASLMAIKAQKELGDGAAVMMIPVSIRMTHLEDVSLTLKQQLSQLLERLAAEGTELKMNHDLSFAQQIERVGHAILCRGLRRRGLLIPESLTNWRDESTDPGDILNEVAVSLLQLLEEEMKLIAKGTVVDRTRAVRSHLAKLRSGRIEVQDLQQEKDWLSRWDDLSMFLLRMQTYDVYYLRTCPSIDRCSETLEKLREDIDDVLVRPFAPRHVHIHFGDPVPVRGRKVAEMTKDLELLVDQGLKSYRNAHIGGEMVL